MPQQKNVIGTGLNIDMLEIKFLSGADFSWIRICNLNQNSWDIFYYNTYMGSYIELNDTLQITTEQGFPIDILNLEKHQSTPITLEDMKNKVFEFHNKSGARIYHLPPCRCFLVHNINGKWLYWGKIIMLEQTISGDTKETQTTSGKYKIIEVYDPEYQMQITKHETSEGLSYF